MQTQRHAQRFSKKTLCQATLLLNVLPNRSPGPSCRSGMSAAQHNAPRQGSALPSMACQTTKSALPPKKNAMPNVISNVFFVLQGLTSTP